MKNAFSLRVKVGDESYVIGYGSVAECLGDPTLPALLDREGANCILVCGELLLTGRPLESFAELERALLSNEQVILRRLK